jgi:phage terminase large subunit-like protein
MVRMDQSMKALSPASKEVEILVKTAKIKHKNQPFIDWCISNCEVFTDVNENIKIRKGEDPALKIDPVVALIMAVGRACANGALETPTFGVYFG